MAVHRASDRWITPGVVIAGLLVGGALTALLIAATAWLAVRGVDPDPMVKTVGAVVAGATSLGTLVLQLVTRATTTKVERNTGLLAGDVAGVRDEIAALPAVAVPAAPFVPPAADTEYYGDSRASVPPLPPVPQSLLRSPR